MSATNDFAGGKASEDVSASRVAQAARIGKADSLGSTDASGECISGRAPNTPPVTHTPACNSSHYCPRCHNRGFYHDNDERFRSPVWTRCDCAAGQED